jgi:hypothetical protein
MRRSSWTPDTIPMAVLTDRTVPPAALKRSARACAEAPFSANTMKPVVESADAAAGAAVAVDAPSSEAPMTATTPVRADRRDRRTV